MKNMKPRSQLEKRIDGSGTEYVGGKGIEVNGNVINLKIAQAGAADYNQSGKYLGGVYIGQGLKIDYDGRLSIVSATAGIKGGIEIGNGLRVNEEGYCSVNIGSGMRYNPREQGQSDVYYGTSISPNLGDGFKIDPSEDEEDPDYGKIHLNLGKGLTFGEREYDKMKNPDGTDREEDDPTRYTSEVQLKLGKGLAFGADGELIAEGGGGKELKAGDGINISDTDVISLLPASGAKIGGVKAGKNVKIQNDGTIDVEGAGGAELSAGGGITIETDGETGKQTISAAVGEGAEIRDGKICTVPNIQNAVLITEADAKYLLHNFTQIEYNAGNRIGYAGPGNQIVVQGMVCYKNGGTAPNGAAIAQNLSIANENNVPDVPTYTDYNFDPPFIFGTYNTVRYEVRPDMFYTDYYTFRTVGTKSDGTEYIIGPVFTNYDGYPLGFAFAWTSIRAPDGSYEFGAAVISIYVKCKDGKSTYAFRSTASATIPFASLAEYQAAVGLTYEPLTLTEVVDNPTVVSGKEAE